MPSFSYNNGKNTISNPFHFKISATNYISIISKNFWRFLVDSNGIEYKMDQANKINYITTGSKAYMYYRNMGNFFWKLAFDDEPLYTKNGKREHSSTVSNIGFIDSVYRDYYVCFFNSSLFFMLWNTYSDCYHLKIDVDTFKPFDSFTNIDWHCYVKRLMTSYKKGGYIQTEAKKNGDVTKYYRYFPQLSKPIIDEIDKVLAKHYGFTEEELDFIINYDIKYRMGDELSD